MHFFRGWIDAVRKLNELQDPKRSVVHFQTVGFLRSHLAFPAGESLWSN